ncbi:MAG: hypothetical protein J6B29_06360 [Clostridia bacterium]|nr:hypothetical protein [Clostridia bacterium]
MGKKPLAKHEVIERIKKRKTFLYKVDALTTHHYTNDAIDYILENEIQLVNGEYELKDAKKITRIKSYNQNHDKSEEMPKEGELMCSEKWLVKNMFSGKIDHDDIFGELIDYEVPLNNKRNDGAGDIDFISRKNGKLWIVEIKNYDSDESILKAILEIQSYYQIVDKEKLISDYCFPKDIEIEKVVAVFDRTDASKQYKESDKVKELINLFDIRVVRLIRYADNELCEAEY